MVKISKKQVFLDTILDAVLRYAPEYNLFPSVVLAQASLESAWGTSDIARGANNWFGIKAQAGYSGRKGQYWTWEEVNGRPVKTLAWFREYDSPAQSVIDHAIFLQKPRYTHVISALTPEDAAYRLKDAGYATDSKYPTKLIAQINNNNFKQYDGQAPTPESPIKKPKVHWAEKHFDSLNNKGITIHSKLYDTDLLRGDAFIMCDVAKNKFHQR